MKHFFWVFLFCVSSVTGQGVPDPADLAPNWREYFRNGEGELQQRVTTFREVLDRFAGEIEEEETKKDIASLNQEISSYLELLLLAQNGKEEQISTWITKATYSLKDYLAMADEARELKKGVTNQETELQRLKYRLKEEDQNNSNAYVAYRNLPPQSEEKLLKGLQLLASGLRSLYLEKQIDSLNKKIKFQKGKIDTFLISINSIQKNLNIKINLSNYTQKKEEAEKEFETIRQELMQLRPEKQRLGAEAPPEIFDKRLTALFIRNLLMQAQLVFFDAVTKLQKTLENPEITDVDLNEVDTFLDSAEQQFSSWEQGLAIDIDRLSQMLLEAKDQPATEEHLKIALDSRIDLNQLDQTLHHIKLIENLIEASTHTRRPFYSSLLDFYTYIQEHLSGWFNYSLFEIGGSPITFLGILKAILIIFGAFVLSKLIGTGIKKVGARTEPTIYTLRRLLHYVIVISGIIIALSTLGLTFSNIAIIIGALGIGIGFGLQNIVNNFLCGLAILFERNVKIGDYVELESGLKGKITEVNVQNTTIHTHDGLDILVPNSMIVGKQLVNWTKKDPFQRLHVPFGVAYGTDQEQVRQVVLDAIKDLSPTLDQTRGVPNPEVWLVKFGESSLDFELVVWVNIYRSRGHRALTALYLSTIETAFKHNGITIPFPQRDLHLKTFPHSLIK